MLRSRNLLLFAFATCAFWSAVSAGQGCNDSFPLGGGGTANTGGFGGTTQGIGGHNYATCDACLNPHDGAPVHECESEFDACEVDATCRKLVECIEHGITVNPTGAGGATSGGTGGVGGTSSSGPGTGGVGGTVTASGGSTPSGSGGSSTLGSGGASAMTHGPCDTSLTGGCCVLDCIAAIDPPAGSKVRFLERTRCLSCATCKLQCEVSDAYCSTLSDNGANNCGN